MKLLDFGLAQLISDERSRPRESGLTGTVPYMSPEQIRGDTVDGRSDVFSLGVVLYEMLCLRRPFDAGSTDATLSAILEHEPGDRDLLRYPSELRRLVMRMLAKSRFERPVSETVAHQLRAIRHSLDAARDQIDETTVERSRPQPRVLTDAPHNLPPVERPLVGREDERRAILELLEQPEVRLITMTGSGGSGKTHLALEIGKQLRGRFPDGVFFVSLAQVDEPNLVPAAIAHALGLRETEAYGAEDRLLTEVRHKEMFLILDNFEHVIGAAGFLSSLLTAAEGVRLLVTSREPVRTRWEQEFPLDPLPSPARGAAMAEMEKSPAVELFVQEAMRTSPGFELNAENAVAVAEICRALDGLPLAISLAAARVKLLTPRAIASRLSNPLSLLKGGSRDLPSRQRTMRDTIDWSVRLLSEEEQRFFARFSVFNGGCDIEAAGAVQDMPDEDTLEMLGTLVDKSLLRRETSSVGDVRFAMFEAIRQFASTMLGGDDDQNAVRDRHASHYAKLAQRTDSQLIGETQPIAMTRLESDHANFRSALDWSLHCDDAKTALELAGSLWRFWNLGGRFREGRARLHEVLAATKAEGPRRMRAVYGAGVLADAQGDFEAAHHHFSEMLELAREQNDEWGVANALNNLGITALRRGDLEGARSLQQRSLELWRTSENHSATALSLQNL
ncbi:MAG: tetratricopeptide repeat protein, partial [Thermoanaerobaculia bacterium]|nr:tetratricopeptide repeat protein [Thermoanaerobaculia bacterium]